MFNNLLEDNKTINQLNQSNQSNIPTPYDPYNDVNMNIEEKTTNVVCWWDEHTFTNNRWGIPTKYVNNKFHVYGCFCSPNCAAAYLFNNYKDTDDIWNKYSLLNFMYNSVYNSNISIRLAPSKLLLKKYGGNLSITDYRKSFNNKYNNYYINIPNQIVCDVNIENINNDDNNNNKDNELRLFRRGPIIDYNKTLDNTMNLNISD
tara:strand:- start:272 stop:883 length:612 start_codon:yes stop_codon:yes gene_type:complete